KKIYVEHRFADGRGLDQLIAAKLRDLGYDATGGPLTLMPDGVDAVVSYTDSWNWDFSLYLIELDIEVSDPGTGKILATASYRHPTIGKTPADMTRAVIDPLFKRG
ncbi:MAG: hypothetical protein KGJ37_05130, partial [Verrucomicrobiota bacterium]|nr:hypothetical protein [Verrucomicrobiota bacterium]